MEKSPLSLFMSNGEATTNGNKEGIVLNTGK